MDHDETIDQLNHLVNTNREAESGLRDAAERVDNSELESLFNGYAKQHARFEAELLEEIKRLGGLTSNAKTTGGALRKGWLDLKSALSGHSAGAILASCESGEESAEIAYNDAVLANRSGQTHTLIDKHLQQIKGFHTRLCRLVGETEDGVDFQKTK